MKLRRIWRLGQSGLVLSFAALSLSPMTGCSCTGDPRSDDYFCAQRNMTTYQNQLNQKQQTAENLQDQNVQLQRDNKDLSEQQQDLNQQIDEISRQLHDLDGELTGLNKKIDTAKSTNAVDQQKLSLLNRELQRVQDETKLAESDTSPTVTQRQAELDRLKKRYQDLQRDLDALLQAH
jgi:chromosome segregation ATPase